MRVCVIGAGVAGLVSAKVLKNDGFDVTVFEKDATVGGVWAPSRAYAGLRTNNPRETYAFSDFPYPATSDAFPTARQVHAYLTSYAKHFGLEPHLRCSTEVVSVARRPSDDENSHPGFRVTVRPVDDSGGLETHDFDFVVVCNGVFSKPYVPRLRGRKRFAGLPIHSSEVADAEVLKEKRVVVVGGGKSALDCATVAAHEAASCTLVFRTPHWTLPRYFFGRVRVDRVLFTRLSEWLLPAYHRATRVETALRAAAAPLLGLWRRGMSRLIPRLTGMPSHMVPETPVTSGAPNIGIGEKFYEVVQQGWVQAKRARILAFSGKDTMQLDTGEEIDADIVIFATGWQQEVPFLDPELRRAVRHDGHFHLFRHILPPRERRLGFIGYASSANCPLTSEVAAHWLSQWFRGELDLPDAAEMEQEIARVRAWAAEVFPSRHEGYFIGAYVAQYVDELMRDMGLPTRRTANPFSEYLAPLWAERYSDVVKERKRVRTRARPDNR